MRKILIIVSIIGLLLGFISTLTSKIEYQKKELPKVASTVPLKAQKAPIKRIKHKVVHYTRPEVSRETKAYIDDIFGEKAEIATAVLIHESGLRLDAINYNCFYNGKSKTCHKEDRNKAWSVDCSIGQINVKGKICPPELMTLEGNMKQVKKIYKSQGLKAWFSFVSGAYKKFL